MVFGSASCILGSPDFPGRKVDFIWNNTAQKDFTARGSGSNMFLLFFFFFFFAVFVFCLGYLVIKYSLCI